MKLEARCLTYRYRPDGKPVLSNLSFECEPGQYWCIAGPNGSGKSTLLKLACGLLPIETFMEGELLWDGKPIQQWRRLDLAKNVGYVAGSLRTNFPVTVEEFVLQGRYSHSTNFWSIPKDQDRQITMACLERIGIAPLAATNITEISAGEAQLAMIARALAQQPRVLILDEATANLDLYYQARIFEILAELNQQGLAIFVVSHDLSLAAEFCPNALWLNDGQLFSQGPMELTLTNELMRDLYDMGYRIEIGRNPFTSRPKPFWKQ